MYVTFAMLGRDLCFSRLFPLLGALRHVGRCTGCDHLEGLATHQWILPLLIASGCYPGKITEDRYRQHVYKPFRASDFPLPSQVRGTPGDARATAPDAKANGVMALQALLKWFGPCGEWVPRRSHW